MQYTMINIQWNTMMVFNITAKIYLKQKNKKNIFKKYIMKEERSYFAWISIILLLKFIHYGILCIDALSHLCLLFYLKQNRIVRCFFRSSCFTRLSFHFVLVGLDAIKSYFKKYDNIRPKGFTCFRREDKTKPN